MTDRRVPRWSDVRSLLQPRRIELNPTNRRLAKALTIADLRVAARRRTPRAVFDYTDGAAEQEISLRRARTLFDELELRPSVLRDVSKIDPSIEVLGVRSALPFAFAPTGFTRMMHREGEPAVARVAERFGIPYALSTLGTSTIEEVAEAAPTGRNWFQLYVWRDRAAAEDLMHRAKEFGFEALILTVDTPVAGARHRDTRNGLAIPPELTLRTIADGAMHPHWWINLLTTAPLTFASMRATEGTIAGLVDRLFDPSMTIGDLEWVRQCWGGPLVVKGIQTVEDAERIADVGVDAVVLSNHGGRQLDRAPIPLRLLPDVVDKIGDRVEVWLDTGVMRGADVVAAIALGARLVLVGRAYLYGLMAGGERGVQRAAEILAEEVRRTMALLGAPAAAHLAPHHVRLP